MRAYVLLGMLAAVAVTVSGCVLPYYVQAIGGQIGLMRQREPIEEVIADPGVDRMTRERLVLVTELREFAVSRLGLPDNNSYTSYVDLGRDYVVYNVMAAEEFSVDPVTWCFPVAGCVSYRGYFDPVKARAFADKLRARGHDTFTAGSPAYSTLGHFADPVLNTMLSRGDVEIAGTLFHELAHQQVYIKGDTELSESFASAVEQYGVETWLESAGRGEALLQYRERLRRQRAFADLVAQQRERLRVIYASGVDDLGKRRDKAASFDRMRQEYTELKREWGGSGDYDFWFEGELNNASLNALSSYQRWVPGLRTRLDRMGPGAFYREIEALAKQDPGERRATLEAWNSASVTAVGANRR